MHIQIAMIFININAFASVLTLLGSLLQVSSQALSPKDYVISECYGDIFNFDCGDGHRIRIYRDFFGHSNTDRCHYTRGDCIISNPKSNSLIHRYCTGRRVCTYYLGKCFSVGSSHL